PSHSSSPTATQQAKPARPGPVLAVKIDNSAAARPQTGIDQADVVYVERVEAGITRFCAVFSSRLPESIGPVRSARETDLDLLRQYENPVLAYSGAQGKLKPHIRRAPLRPMPPEELSGYFRGGARPAPHNLYLRTADVLKAAPDIGTPQDVGFDEGPAPAGGKATPSRTVRFPAARYAFAWKSGGWQVSMDGRPSTTAAGKRLAPANVVIQEVDIRKGAFGDRWGNNSPYTETVGAGTATVLRDGKAYPVRWERPEADTITEYETPDGKPMRFADGQVWVVYVPKS
ncbi:DUF3048 domain-containing protein, partial [Streptomyces sp. A7024]